MLQALRNIWDVPDLRKRVLFTLGLLAVYRIGNHVPTPGINAQSLIDFFEQNRGNWFGLVDMFSGGNLAKVTIFALGITRPPLPGTPRTCPCRAGRGPAPGDGGSARS